MELRNHVYKSVMMVENLADKRPLVLVRADSLYSMLVDKVEVELFFERLPNILGSVC